MTASRAISRANPRRGDTQLKQLVPLDISTLSQTSRTSRGRRGASLARLEPQHT